MSRVRLIARLDVKAPNLIKGIHLEGLRKIGDPNDFAKEYYENGIDEIIYIDAVASLYERNSLIEIVKQTTQDVFVPITVGGGLRSVNDVREALRAGADKVAINTAAIKRPELIREVAETFGSQCMVLSVAAKRYQNKDGWEALTDGGREHSHIDVLEWIEKAQEYGAGEILITSVDQEGTRKGFDVELIKAVTERTSIPIIASGGMGEVDHAINLVNQAKPSAIAMADILHYKRITLPEIRNNLSQASIDIRGI